jgi:hypothetical protein
MVKEKRRFRLSAKESEGDFISFTADGGDIVISGVTGRCPDVDYVDCVKRLVKKMIKAPETPPYWIRHMAESVLQHLLQMTQEIGWKTSISAGAGVYIYDEDGPELTLDIAISYGTPPKKYYSEEEYYFDDHENEWYISINSCCCGFETHYNVERILRLGSDDPHDLRINPRELRRAVITTVKQAYNATP